nr:zinc finger CCCH domain-containing protein 5-like isoform X2 [Solanum lycopersicum]
MREKKIFVILPKAKFIWGKMEMFRRDQSTDDVPVTEQASSNEETGLEEPMRQLSVGTEAGSYPERPNEPDCIYYLRNGICGYGSRCRFNHPRDRSLAVGERRATGGEYPERAGQYVCQYYMRTGMCRFGASCKYHHPRQGEESPSLVIHNIFGYPLRPNEKECAHYMKTGHCKFGIICKFNHPQPTGVQVPASAAGPFPLPAVVPPPATYPELRPLPVDSAEQYGIITGNWPVIGPALLSDSYTPDTYGPMFFPPEVVPVSDWTHYLGSTSPVPCQSSHSAAGTGPVPSQTTQSAAGAGPIYGHTGLSASAPAYASPYASLTASRGASSSIQDGLAFPERPGQPECHYYMKYGDCKFGSSCKYQHPPESSGSKAALILRAMGLPPDLEEVEHVFLSHCIKYCF